MADLFFIYIFSDNSTEESRSEFFNGQPTLLLSTLYSWTFTVPEARFQGDQFISMD